MPGKVKVKIISGKNLPVMDRSSDTTDAYVEIKLGNTTYKTDVCRRTLHPQWNTDWYRFEVDDSELQDEPLQIRLMDHDTYSANDAIGKVYLNLNPLLLPVAGELAIGDNNPHHEISGWIPVYDTMHGIRGEVNVTVKVELFSDFNRYRQSSCGVYFFYCVKALNLGGNAVIGYRQSFDLEGESGIVARGIGTAVTLVKSYNVHHIVVETKEEDIQNYLKFVGDGKSFSLRSASPSHKFHFPCSPLKPFTPLNITSVPILKPKLAKLQYSSLDYNRGTPSLSNPNLQENDRTSIKTLLNQEDKRGESAMSRRFQKFKDSQKSLSKKMIALKAKLNDSIGEEVDEDLAAATFDKRKFFKRTASDSSAMAEILARSVIHATSSLSSILEDQNICKEDDTMQKLEPIANLLNSTETPTSITDDNISDAQSYSSSDSSSSCSDYEYKYYGQSNNDVETISNIITNVEKLQRCLSRERLYKQTSLPAFPTRGFSLSSLDTLGKYEACGNFNVDNLKEEMSIKKESSEEAILESTSNLVDQYVGDDLCSKPFSSDQEALFLEGDYTGQIEGISKINHDIIKTLQVNNDERKNVDKNPFQSAIIDNSDILGYKKNQVHRERFCLPEPKDQDISILKNENANSINSEAKNMFFEQGNTLHIIKDAVNEEQNLTTDMLESSDGQSKNTEAHLDFAGMRNRSKFVYPLIKSKNVSSGSLDEIEVEPKSFEKKTLPTLLLERVNISGTSTKEIKEEDRLFPSPDDIHSENITTLQPHTIKTGKNVALKCTQNVQTEDKTIVKTALQTMAFERTGMLGTPTDELNNKYINFPHTKQTRIEEDGIASEQKKIYSKSMESNLESKGIVKTALQTMLFERANILGTSEDRPVENCRDEEINKKDHVSEDFTIEGSLNKEQKSIKNINMDHLWDGDSRSLFCEKTNEEGSISSLPNTPNTMDEIQGIAPVSREHISIEPKKMVKTAMQTMLLEKVNILGTYTPPTSPTFSAEDSNVDKNSIFTFNELKGSEKKGNISKSLNSVSFGKQQRQRDTVLGMLFTSLSSLTSEYDDKIMNERMSCFSDSDLHKPIIQTLKEKDSSGKKRFKFLHTKAGNTSKHSGMFNKFLKHGKKSLPEEDFQKEAGKEYHQNILSRMFHLRHEEKSIKDEETQTSNEMLDHSKNPKISETNQNSSNIAKNDLPFPKPPSNTDLASGDFLAHDKTKLACITSNRHHSSPAQDKHEYIGGDRKNEHSPDSVVRISHSPVKVNYMVPLHRRSSDSDLSITPKGNSLTGSDRSVGNAAAYFMRNSYVRRGMMNQEHFEMLEYPFLTMTKFSPRFIVQIGGSISARSVKLLERILNPEEPESRDIWWSEIRMEIRSHARSLNCNAVLGYTESTSICEDVCVLSACGTAAVVDLNSSRGDDDNISNVQLFQRNIERDKNLNGQHKSSHDSPEHREYCLPPCSITHLPYDEKTVPVKAKVTKCPLCLKGKVPEVLLATIEPTESIPNVGKGCFIESHVSRPLKDLRGETIAKEISDGLPFLEYELHRLLVNKLKIRGMNAIFSLKIRITVGEKLLVGVATGTAIYLSSLPSPDLPMLVTDRVSDEKIVADLQEMLKETVKKNREIYQIKDDNLSQKPLSDDDSDDEQASLDISCGNKDCCILEMDDPEDAEVLNLLMEEKIPDGFHVVSTEAVPGLEDLEIVKNLQMFMQIYRAKLAPPYNLQKHFVRLLQSVYFKLRRMVPCALCDLQFRVDLPEPDEIQLCVIGMALGLGKKIKKVRPVVVQKRPEEDLMFKLDEDPQDSPPSLLSKSNPSSLKYRGHRSPSKYRTQSIKQRHTPCNERHGVDITPLSYVPGGNIEQYLGNLNFFFIRETTSIREEGGLSGFIHSFITEVLAIVRSHVTALGGNALVAFFMTECVLNHNLHKNQGQCLINVGGDVVSVSYFKDDP